MELKIERVGTDGEGIAYLNKKPVYIYYAYLDEVVKVDVFENKRGSLEGSLIAVLEKSVQRRENIYEDLRLNTASNLMHINYFEQLKFKRRTVQFLINKEFRKNDIRVLNTIPSVDEFHYRNKIDLPVRFINGKNQMGLYIRGSREFIPITSYVTHQEVLDEIANVVLRLMDKYHLNAYNNKTKRGYITNLSIRANLENEVQVTFIMRKDTNLDKLIKELEQDIRVVSVYKILNKQDDFNIFNGEITHLSGSKTLNMKLDKYLFPLTPKAFFQLNTKQALNLYEIIIKEANFKKSDVVLDAYSGVGTIATFISPFVKEVVAIESVKASVNQMEESFKVNKINNVKAITGDVLKVVKYLKLKFDKIVFDPPRTGLGEQLINFLLKHLPKTIIYTSCNPITLASDLKSLSESYEIVKVIPLDMFPNTSQIESVTILNLKE